MSSIEDLMDANNFNFRLMATVPAVMAVSMVYLGAKNVRSYVFGIKSRKETYAVLRTMLLDLERVLSRYCAVVEQRLKRTRGSDATGVQYGHSKTILEEPQNNGLLGSLWKRSSTLSRSIPTDSHDSSFVCSDIEVGLLLSLAWRFRRLLAETAASSSRRLERDDALALHADVDELCHGGLDPARQLALVKRISASYHFLAVSSPFHGESAYAYTFLR